MFKAARILGSLGVFACISLLSVAPLAAGAADLGNGWDPTPLEAVQLPDCCQRQFMAKNDGKVLRHPAVN